MMTVGDVERFGIDDGGDRGNGLHIFDYPQVVDDAEVICGLSGGVDSAVAAALVHKAVGDKLTCVFVDHGLLRQDEREQVERDYVAATGIKLVVVDARERFLSELAGVSDPEAKRKAIGLTFLAVEKIGRAHV